MRMVVPRLLPALPSLDGKPEISICEPVRSQVFAVHVVRFGSQDFSGPKTFPGRRLRPVNSSGRDPVPKPALPERPKLALCAAVCRGFAITFAVFGGRIAGRQMVTRRSGPLLEKEQTNPRPVASTGLTEMSV